MLIAGPSTYYNSSSYQTAADVSSRRPCSNSNSGSSDGSSESNKSSATNSSTYSIIKSFAGHFKSGTEIIKQTVQKFRKSISSDDPVILSPSKTHRTQANISPESESCDSTKLEVCHFKPIKVLPLTPKSNYSPANTALKTPQPQFLNTSTSPLNFFRRTNKPRCTRKLLKSATSAFSTLAELHHVSSELTPRKISPRKTTKRNLSADVQNKTNNTTRLNVKRKLCPVDDESENCDTTVMTEEDSRGIRPITRKMSRMEKTNESETLTEITGAQTEIRVTRNSVVDGIDPVNAAECGDDASYNLRRKCKVSYFEAYSRRKPSTAKSNRK